MLSAPTPDNGRLGTPAKPAASEAATESRLAFERSLTFVRRMPDPAVHYLRRTTVITILAFAFVVIPLLDYLGVVPDYKVNLLGKYLCFAIAALGIDLIWGYTGLLSLCQALFFCIGGYAMAMHLSLPQGWGDVQAVDHYLPNFLSFNAMTQLPAFWKPFESFGVSIALSILLPGLLAFMLGFFILRSRVRGVYFAIVTQAVAWGAWLLISRNEMLLGGTNGLTNFYKPFTTRRAWIVGLYLLTLVVLVIAYLICRAIVGSRLGRVLVAIRDRETRLYFAGYKPYAFKVFAFAVGAMLAALGGMLYPTQVTIISPQDLNVEQSMFMVVWVAAGGRGKLWGAVFGALLLNVLKSSLSSDLPSIWLFVEGLIFVSVVLLFPDGFVGIWAKLEEVISLRAGWSRIAVAASPLAIVSLFIVVEALGLEPPFLQHGINVWLIPNPVQWKYLLLVALLGTTAAAYRAQKRADQRETRVRPVPSPALVAEAGGRVSS